MTDTSSLIVVIMIIIAGVGYNKLNRDSEEKSDAILQAEKEGSEFKILRARLGKPFNNPVRQSEILKEEAAAGWELYEVLDGSRIKLRRSIESKKQEKNQQIDPYREFIPITLSDIIRLSILLLVMLIGAAVIGTGLGFLFDAIGSKP